jgi:protein gp37
MPMNKTSGNMYEWITHTWNPVRGRCSYNCSYCYVRRWGEQPELRLDQKELKTNLGHGNYIFVCSGCDLFNPDVPDGWICPVIDRAHSYTSNRYLWHTKNPGRALYFQKLFIPGRDILCATVESNIPWPGISKAPQPFDRIESLKKWSGEKMITIEPVMDFDVMTFSEMIVSCKPSQVNIGADSGNNGLPEPPKEKLEVLLDILAAHTRIRLKRNLRRILPESGYYGNAEKMLAQAGLNYLFEKNGGEK